MKKHQFTLLKILAFSVLAFALSLGPSAGAATKKKSVKAKATAPKTATKLAPPGTPKDARLPEPKSSEEGETAFRSIAIGVFLPSADSAPEGFEANEAVALCEEIARDLRAKSYLSATCLKQKIAPSDSSKALADLGRKREVDALLAGSVGPGSIELTLISARSGKIISTFKGDSPKRFDGAGRSKAADAVVDELVLQVPYRGFVVRVEAGLVDINLGSSHGLRKGTMLTLFHIAGGNLSGAQSIVGTAEVVEVLGSDLATARVVDKRGPIGEFTKISHEDAAPPKQAAIVRTASGGNLLSAGLEFLTIETALNGTLLNLNREYTMASTPFVRLGFAGARWFADLWYGYASDTEETLSYTSLVAAYQFKAIGGFKSGYAVSIGGWVSQYSASATRVTTTRILEDSTRYSPYLELRYQYVPSQRWMFFASGELNYLILATGQQSSQIPFSYAVGTTPGIRYNINNWISMELGARYQYLTIPLAGKNGTFETHLGYFAKALLWL